MISIENALAAILCRVRPLPSRRTAIADCLDRILAEDVRAKADIPPFSNSAMDGYAVRAADTRGAARGRSVRLPVAADLPAGRVYRSRLFSGQAVRIMTGAPLPKGADAVVIIEDTRPGRSAAGGRPGVLIMKEVRPGENVRRAGESVKKGELILPRGKVLRPPEIGMLAALGRPMVKVIPGPRVAIISTGDELQEINKNLAPGKIFDCNRYSLTALIRQYGGLPVPLGMARDREGELTGIFRKAGRCDLIIASGGVSVGKYDLVKKVLAGMSGRIKIWRIAIKPGKPLAFGLLKGKPVFGLPGNPVSVIVSFLIFVRPALLTMQGKTRLRKPEVAAILAEDCSEVSDRTHLVRVKVAFRGGAAYVRPTGPQGSGILSSLVFSNALMVVPPGKGPLRKGARVRVILTDEPEI